MSNVILRIPRRQAPLPPLTAFGMTLFLALLGWAGIWELIRGVTWLVRLALQ